MCWRPQNHSGMTSACIAHLLAQLTSLWWCLLGRGSTCARSATLATIIASHKRSQQVRKRLKLQQVSLKQVTGPHGEHTSKVDSMSALYAPAQQHQQEGHTEQHCLRCGCCSRQRFMALETHIVLQVAGDLSIQAKHHHQFQKTLHLLVVNFA